MKKRHIIMAILVSFFWGVNAPIVKLSLNHVPLYFLCAVRSLLLGLLVFVFPKTVYPKSIVSLFSLAHGLKITALYTSITVGLSVGLSTVILQTHSIFAVVFALIFLKEKIFLQQYLGLFLSFLGGVIISHQALQSGNTFLGLSLGIIAAIASSFTLLLVRNYKKVTLQSSLSFVGWFNLFAVIPFFILSLAVEGKEFWLDFSWIYNKSFLLLLGLGAMTVIGAYSFLSLILAKNQTGEIAGFLLLTPVFGLASSYMCLGEYCTLFSIVGTFVVILGVAINQGVSLKSFTS